MGPGPEQQRLDPTERANLVAYLDGELGPAERESIATKLVHSVTARREVEALERTWELLGHLPKAEAPADLVERTLEGARRLDSRGGELESTFTGLARRGLRAMAWLVAVVLAGGLGYFLTQQFLPNPSARLACDLSIAEHLDEYLTVRDFEFLRSIANSPEFGTDRID